MPFLPSSGSITQVVNPAPDPDIPTITTVTSSNNPSFEGDVVVFEGVVEAAGVMPVGMVEWFIDGVSQGAPTPVLATPTVLQVPDFVVGSHVVECQFTP